jgi:hypothetical protein
LLIIFMDDTGSRDSRSPLANAKKDDSLLTSILAVLTCGYDAQRCD